MAEDRKAPDAARILLADADPQHRARMREALAEAGLEGVEAGDGIQVLERLEELHPAALVLDEALPGLSGPSLCAVLRRRPEHRETPILLLLGAGDEGGALRSLRAGASDVLLPPVPAPLLLRRLASGLELAEARRRLAQGQHLRGVLQRRAGLASFELQLPGAALTGAEELCALLGLPAEEPLEVEGLLELLEPESREKLRGLLQWMAEGGDHFSLETRSLGPGAPQRLLWQGEGFADEQGIPAWVLGSVQKLPEEGPLPASGRAGDRGPWEAGAVPAGASPRDAGFQVRDASGEEAAGPPEERLRLQSLADKLGVAFEEGDLCLYYQPQVELGSGRITGVEALLRWNDAELGSISPQELLETARHSGRSGAIGEWVLERAGRQAAAWREAGLPPLRMAVNLAPAHLVEPAGPAGGADPGLPAAVSRILFESGLPAVQLVLEVTEEALQQCGDAGLSVLFELRRLGVHLALDDFGKGCASLGLLRRLPVDVLKIDASLVQHVAVDPDAAALAQAILSAARGLGLESVAVGVETERQRQLLEQYGCRWMQGYLVGPPLPAGEIPRRLRGALRLRRPPR